MDRRLGTLLLNHFHETDPVETLVLDSTDFWWENSRTGERRREFSVLLAFGYPGPGARNTKARVWGIYAAHTATAADWVTFLSSLNLPAPPESVVCDDNLAVPAALTRLWGSDAPFQLSCEHHLRENAVKALKADGIGHWGSVRMAALNNAFTPSPTGRRSARSPTGPSTRPPRHGSRVWMRSSAARPRSATSCPHTTPPAAQR